MLKIRMLSKGETKRYGDEIQGFKIIEDCFYYKVAK